MLATVAHMIAAVEESDLGLDPDFTAPWISVVRDLAGWVVGTLFVVSGIILAIGVVVFFVAKAASNSRQQDSGVKAMLLGLAGVFLLGSVGALLVWVAGFDPFEEEEDAQAAVMSVAETV